MNGNRYINFAPLLALMAFALSLSPVTMPVISAVFDIPSGNHTSLAAVFGLLMLLGWAPGFALAILAEHLLQRIHSHTSVINITRAISLLAIIVSFCWVIVLISVPLISRFISGR